MSTPGSASPGGLSVNGTMPAWAARVEGNPLLDFIDYCLRGVGQVCFMNNPVTGLAILVAMAVAEPWLGFAGALGLVVSNLAAILIGMDRGAIRAGLFGFNGVLVGAGMSLFLQPDWDILVMVWIVVGASLSTVLHGALAAVFIGAWKVPPFTFAFNFITLIFLIGRSTSPTAVSATSRRPMRRSTKERSAPRCARPPTPRRRTTSREC